MSETGPVRVGYLGPAGTFSEEAVLRSARPDGVEPVALATIYDTVIAVRDGTVEWAVVPIENSLDGSVTVTLDLIADEQLGLQIVGEVLLEVRHSLIAAQDIALGEIETVISHPKVPGQCTRFLRGELAHARVLAASSTAEAVRTVVAEGAPAHAALGTRLAADIYGGTVLREGVQDRDDNKTRFVWIARMDAGGGAPPLPPLRSFDGDHGGGDGVHERGAGPLTPETGGAAMKTSLVFWGEGAERPGWLLGCLSEFAERGINLTKIESRPRRSRLGHYMFFVDLQGSLEDQAVSDAVSGLRVHCEQARVLGSYPAG